MCRIWLGILRAMSSIQIPIIQYIRLSSATPVSVMRLHGKKKLVSSTTILCTSAVKYSCIWHSYMFSCKYYLLMVKIFIVNSTKLDFN